MPSQLTIFPGHGPSRTFVWDEGRSQFAGREPECDICLEDPRVSARHALFQWSGGAWVLVDLRSKNGTFVNGARISEVPLQSGDWISFGGLLSRHEKIRDADVQALEQERAARRARGAQARRNLDATPAVAFWSALLAEALELTGAVRGFAALFPVGDAPGLQVAWGFAPFEPLDESFDPMLAAVEAILRDGNPVALLRRGELGKSRRGTLEELGDAAMAAVPLSRGGRVTGVLHVEGRRQGGSFNDLDLELLELIAQGVSAGRGAVEPARAGEPPGPRETAPGPGRPFIEQLGHRLSDLVRAEREASPSRPTL